MVHFEPKMANMAGLSMFQGGPKRTEMVNHNVLDHLEPFWTHWGPFEPFQTKNESLLRSTSVKPYFVYLGQKIHFCLK